MSGLALTKMESELLAAEGWQTKRTSDGLEFFMDLGQRQIRMFPAIMRSLKPMSFRTQARRYDAGYCEVAKAVGWGGDIFFSGKSKSLAMSTFKIDQFDETFSKELTQILKDWALADDPRQLVAESIERRKKVRYSLIMADLIDYAYLRRTRDLEKISLEERDDGVEYISPMEKIERLEKAIEISKRPL